MYFFKTTKIVSILAIAGLVQFQAPFGGTLESKDAIGALIADSNSKISKIPLPTPRPALALTETKVASTAPITPKTAAQKASATDANPLLAFLPKLGSKMPTVSAKKGSLRTALKAIRNEKILEAIAIRAGMEDPIDKAILTWRLARTGSDLVPYDMITGFQAEYPDFPTQSTLTRRAEVALSRQKIGFQQVLNIYGDRTPLSIQGIVQKAEALQAAGRNDEAATLIRKLWRTSRLSKNYEKKIRRKFKKFLRVSDHKWRVDMHLYNERTSEASRVAQYMGADYRALVKYRIAATKNHRTSPGLMKKVPSSMRKDPGFIFSKVQRLRRTKNPRDAAALLQTAPTDPKKLVDPDEWWVERRISSRNMLDLGRAQQAYDIAAAHRGGSPATIAEASFHAGWYALRYLNKPKLARKHFEKIAQIAKRSRSLSRAYYWIGRADEAAGNKARAKENYTLAARYPTVFYGQLANEKLGRKKLQLTGNPKITTEIKRRHNDRAVVKAINRLLRIDEKTLAAKFLRSQAQKREDPAEIVLLAKRAEKAKMYDVALQIGRLAEAEGHELHYLSHPIAAIPKKTKVPKSVGKAVVYSIARQESNFNPKAISHVGARGLLQLMPATAKEVARSLKLKYSKSRLLSDPAYNATLGATYLGRLIGGYNGSYIMTFAGYNAGGSRVKRWSKKYGDPRKMNVDNVVDWIERIPFTETRGYVQKIMENMQVYQARLNERSLTLSKDLRKGG